MHANLGREWKARPTRNFYVCCGDESGLLPIWDASLARICPRDSAMFFFCRRRQKGVLFLAQIPKQPYLYLGTIAAAATARIADLSCSWAVVGSVVTIDSIPQHRYLPFSTSQATQAPSPKTQLNPGQTRL